MTKPILWDIRKIKFGIDQFILINGRMPTAKDFDSEKLLPSARQVQRMYGGLPTLRNQLGYSELDFTKGDLRTAISIKASIDGLSAEDKIEKILINIFGEAFVHVQKRYGITLKNRYDFFVYARAECFGIDVFSTSRKEYISANVRHKIEKYRDLKHITIYFIAIGLFTDDDIDKAYKSIPELQSLPHIHLVNESQFLKSMEGKSPLDMPSNFVGVSK